jgi:hypothetical protein
LDVGNYRSNYVSRIWSEPDLKFNSYASFHVSVGEDEFPFNNNTGAWHYCLISPFYGSLTSEQVYSSSSPVKCTIAGTPAADVMPPVAMQIGSASTSKVHGGNFPIS